MAAPEFVVQAGKLLNPWVLRVAGRVPPWVVLHHVGRRSGKEYRTPLVAFAARPEQDIMAVLPLPWGSGTDWARNTMSAGTARLTRGGSEFVVKDLRVVPVRGRRVARSGAVHAAVGIRRRGVHGRDPAPGVTVG